LETSDWSAAGLVRLGRGLSFIPLGPAVADDFQRTPKDSDAVAGAAARAIGSGPPAPFVGELLKIDDQVTGFSPGEPKENRPYVVIEQVGRMVRIVPQSTHGEHGVHVPDGAVDGLEEGWFVPWSKAVPVRKALSGTSIGFLPQKYLDVVRAEWWRSRR
jgi:hypothetical protein